MINKNAPLAKASTSLTVLILSALLTISCAKGSDLSTDNLLGRDSSSSDNGNNPNKDAPATGNYDTYYPLSWENPKSNPKFAAAAVSWSDYAFSVIQNETAAQMLPGTTDITLFCPKYYSLSTDLKINFWGSLFAGIAYYESGYNPTSRMQETTMGTDPVTHLPVYSEGLLQLSYQDITGWPFCDFDWSQDRALSPTDPKKTILDPYRNLECGIKIMAQQISQKHAITLSSGVYWATLKANGKYGKIDEIAAMTKKMIPPCN